MKVKEFAEIKNGFAFKSEKYVDSGIRVIRINNVQKGYIIDEMPAFYPLSEENNLKDYMLEKEDILMSLTGNVGRVGILSEKFLPAALNQRVACIRIDNNKVMKKYIYYAFLSKKFEQDCIKSSQGIAQKNMSTEWLKEYDINIAKIDKQYKIIEIFDELTSCINHYQSQLKRLDTLIKSRFVEMFGDIEAENAKVDKKPMTEVCSIIDGDRGKNYPKSHEFSDDGYCLFLNAKNVTKTGFDFKECSYITKEKDEILRNGKLTYGDVVLTTRGTVGNLAFYNDSIPFKNVRINSGMVILRMKKDVINEVFFIEQFKLLLENIKAKIVSGTAQPQLPISTMNKIMITLPAIEKQKEFVSFIEQVDKSKFVEKTC